MNASSTCFNPFFIRASVYCAAGDCSGGQPPCEFQSLLHQGISLLDWRFYPSIPAEELFQSLLHQGISLLAPYPVCYYICFHVLFQSLLHQGISLLEAVNALAAIAKFRFQSLLHQGISLLGTSSQTGSCWRGSSFNPFFIRASVYCPPGPRRRGCGGWVSIPSSSGHQFTGCAHQRLMDGPVNRFNPFFIRASVYC